jgi:hypothetical protein
MLFASSFPRRDLCRVSLSVVVINTSVKPMSVRVNMEIVKTSELILRMMFQVVSLDHLVFSRLTLIFMSVSIRVGSAFVRLGLDTVIRTIKILLLSGSRCDSTSLSTDSAAS